MSQLIFRFLLAISIFSICAVDILSQKKPARWLYVALSAEGYKHYRLEKIDRLENGNLASWMKTLTTEGVYRNTYSEYDCKNNRFRILQDNFYFADDKLYTGRKEPFDPNWTTPPPDTLAEILFAAVCKPPIAPRIVEITVNRANLRSKPHPQGDIIKTAEKGAQFQVSMGLEVENWFNVVDEATQEDYWIHRSVFEFVEKNK